MADDYTQTLEPPRPTVVSGTGRAVQSATIGDQKWQFDDEGGNWVNLETGEAVSPKVFSQMAGRSGNAASDTIALARAMQREEASLALPQSRIPVMQPQATIAAPMPAAMTGTSPVVPPRAAIARPSLIYSPSEVSRVAAQKPVPSTLLPPSDAAMTFYKQQQVQRMVQQGWKPADALKAVGLGQAPMGKPIHVGNALVDPMTGKPIYTAPPPEMTPAQKASASDRSARTEILRKTMEERSRVALEKAKKQTLTPEQQVKVELAKDQIKKLQDAYANASDEPSRNVLESQIQAALWSLERLIRPPATNAPSISKPATRTSKSGEGDLESQARSAIKAGANEAAVRKRFKELTGANLD